MQELKQIAVQVRRDILRMINGASSGHPGGSLGCADFMTALFFNQMNLNPSNFSINGENEDIFFLSNGHISPVFYSILARRGFFPVKELASFRKLNTRLQGHPTTAENLPGIRMASGSLGQGLSVAAGAALTKKLNNDNGLIYVLLGDGELQEGQNWEAFMFAAHHKIDNLIATIDYNQKQIDGPINEVMNLGDLKLKIESFGWKVMEMDGHNFYDIIEKLKEAKNNTSKLKPVCIIMSSIMGKGVDFMENDHGWHGVAPNDDQLESALLQLEETLGDY